MRIYISEEVRVDKPGRYDQNKTITIVFSGGASDEVINANKISDFSSGEKRE
jgi:hypothetical protein